MRFCCGSEDQAPLQCVQRLLRRARLVHGVVRQPEVEQPHRVRRVDSHRLLEHRGGALVVEHLERALVGGVARLEQRERLQNASVNNAPAVFVGG